MIMYNCFADIVKVVCKQNFNIRFIIIFKLSDSNFLLSFYSFVLAYFAKNQGFILVYPE